jgi:predicted RNA polymerase sigma factor
LIDLVRSDRARAAREAAVAVAQPADTFVSPPPADDPPPHDDSLRRLLLCCHPALTRSSQVALTLRAVSGLSTQEIATAFLVPEATMAQRLSRAKATLTAAGAHFELPGETELPERVAAVLDVLNVVFNEGYTRSMGKSLVDTSLTGEAIRLTRQLYREIPDHDEVAGALALMLLTQARQHARSDARGDLVPLADQDRDAWDAEMISEGVTILERVLGSGHVGRYQLQAAIAAVHAEAPTFADTDWLQITMLYDMLDRVAPGPAVTLNRAVAVGMSVGPENGLAIVEALLKEPAMERHHRTHAVRAHLLEMLGNRADAVRSYQRAAQLTASLPEQRYLHARAQRLA